MRWFACCAIIGTAVVFAGCEREERSFRSSPPAASPTVRLPGTPLHAGPTMVVEGVSAYQENRWAVSEGARLYAWFNCAGCHGVHGGGGIGPPFTDEEWLYGSEPALVFQSIVQGRPDGMPAYATRLNNDEVWKLVAYVRTLGRLTPRDVWPGRTDHMSGELPDGGLRD